MWPVCICVVFLSLTDVFVCYGYNGKKCSNAKWEDYGKNEKWGKSGDTIESIMDLQNMTLSFVVNGDKQGIAYNLDKQKNYHFVIIMFSKNDAICIESQTIVTNTEPSAPQIRNGLIFLKHFCIFVFFVFVFFLFFFFCIFFC